MNLSPLSAAKELAVLRRAPALLPYLMGQGLSLEDAAALAHNATLVFYAQDDPALKSPRQLLERLSLEEIAGAARELARLKGASPHD